MRWHPFGLSVEGADRVSEWTATPADLGWLLDQYKQDVETCLLAEQRLRRTKAKLDDIARQVAEGPSPKESS